MVPAKSDGSSDSSFYLIFHYIVLNFYSLKLQLTLITHCTLHCLYLLTAFGLLDTYLNLSYPSVSSAIFQYHHSLFIQNGYNIAVAFSTCYFQIAHSLALHQNSPTHRATYKSFIFSVYHHNPPVDSNYSTAKGKENH